MNGKSFLILVLTVCWFLFCQRWYCCWMQNACVECNDEPINEYAVAFLPGSIEPDTTALWNELVANLKKDRKVSHILEVSGKYFSRKMGSPELGMDRARNVGKLLKEAFPKDSITLRAQAEHFHDQSLQGYLPLIDLQWIPLERPKPQKLTLYFERKATSLDISLSNDKRLVELVDYATQKSRKIKVEGHSSPTGSERVNIKLSEERAKELGRLLEAKGIPADQIITTGYGSAKSIFPDNPEKNKRVEISILN